MIVQKACKFNIPLLRLIACVLLFSSACLCPVWANATKAYLNAKEALIHNNFVVGVKNYYRFVSFSEVIIANSIRINDLTAAREFFEKAVRIPEKAEQAKLFLALIDRLTDNFEKAHEKIDSLREEHPNSLLLAYVKGELHLAQNQIKDARKYFDWILQADSNSPFAVITKALLQFYSGTDGTDVEERKRFLLAAANRNWDLLEIDQAIRLFEIVAHDFPHEQEAFKSLVIIYLDIDNLAKAIEVHDRWKASNIPTLLAPMMQVRFHCACEEYSEAVEILNKILKEDSTNEQARWMLADCLFNLDKFADALPIYQDILDGSQDNIGVVQRVKTCLEALGKTDEAIMLFETLAGNESANPWFQLELAELYLQSGNYDQSEVYFDLLSSTDNSYSEYAAEMSAKIAQYRQEKAIEEQEQAERLAAAQHEQAVSENFSTVNSHGQVTEKVREVQIEELKKLMAIYE